MIRWTRTTHDIPMSLRGFRSRSYASSHLSPVRSLEGTRSTCKREITPTKALVNLDQILARERAFLLEPASRNPNIRPVVKSVASQTLLSQEDRGAMSETKLRSVALEWRDLIESYASVAVTPENLELALEILIHFRLKWRSIDTLTSHWPLADQNLYGKFLIMVESCPEGLKYCQTIHQLLMEDHPEGPNELNRVQIVRCLGMAESSILRQHMSYVQSLEEQFLPDADIQSWLATDGHSDALMKGLLVLNPRHSKAYVKANYNPRSYQTPLLAELNAREDMSLKAQISEPHYLAGLKPLVQEQLGMEYRTSVEMPSVIEFDEQTVKDKAVHLLLESWTSILRLSLEGSINGNLKRRLWRDRSLSLSNLKVYVYPFLKVLPVKDLTDVVLANVLNLCKASENFSPSLSMLADTLSRCVMVKIRLLAFSKDSGRQNKPISTLTDTLDRYLEWYADPKGSVTHREAFERLVYENQIDNTDPHSISWSYSVRQSVGRELLKVILESLQVSIDSRGNLCLDGQSFQLASDGSLSVNKCEGAIRTFPAFFKVFRTRKHSREIEEMKPHPCLTSLFAIGKLSKLTFSVTELPMLVPPRPWVSQNQGGYLLHEVDLIRVVNEGKIEGQTMQSPDNLLPILDALNQLGSTPWIINRPLLEIIIQVFANPKQYEINLNHLGIPRHPDNINPPETHSDLLQVRIADYNAHQMELYRSFLMEKQLYIQVKSESFSLWCDTLYRLSIAKMFKERVLYFPHNIDFRGRVYPIPPYLNHMGCDLSRSLLIFAEGKPLGERGLDWLKLHVVNLSGLKKKSSIATRLAYANEMLDVILGSARDPFGGQKWWMESDEPWQTLAACMELRKALDSPNPEEYVSHLPIHQDGSCNGLQHYAALGRDVLGAKFVNLIPADTPQDVYGEIAAIVERKRSEDENSGLVPIADVLKGHVQRKVIKQTVMTTVYGVTKYGAKLQIAKQLKDIEAFPLDRVDEAATYLAHRTFDSLNEMFESSQMIQSWFIGCADVISLDFLRLVEWETPLGLNCVQPYVRGSSTRGAKVKPYSVKQRNGFPPNFVHSLDSSHMMLTSLNLWRRGITYASVHDCFWTHPSSVEAMNEVCRDQFVNLHTYPILESLSNSFLRNYLDAKDEQPLSPVQSLKAQQVFKAIPKKGPLDLNLVKQSTFFFS